MMTALHVHYIGKSQKEARQKMEPLIGGKELTPLLGSLPTFTTLDDYSKPVSEEEKLRLLRKKIKTVNASFNASVI
eukprot:13276448-Ditylum_brightwellii.AAC.1